jgi:hypothetical protein
LAIRGGVVSATVTVVVALDVLPWASTAVKVTVVVPSGKTSGASLVTVGTRTKAPLFANPSLTLCREALDRRDSS